MGFETENKKQERAVLVGLNADCFTKEQTATDETMEELEALLETAGGFCTAKVLQNRHTPDSHSFIGEGKAQEVRMLVEATESTMVIFDNELSPGNIRALEEIIGVPVLDRSALILDIFAQRAKTREGRLQVELAQNKYLLPRLSGMGSSPLPAGRRHRHPWPRRNQAGNRPAADSGTHQPAGSGAGAGEPGAQRPAGAENQKFHPGGCHRWLYQCGKIHPLKPAHRCRNSCQQPAV